MGTAQIEIGKFAYQRKLQTLGLILLHHVTRPIAQRLQCRAMVFIAAGDDDERDIHAGLQYPREHLLYIHLRESRHAHDKVERLACDRRLHLVLCFYARDAHTVTCAAQQIGHHLGIVGGVIDDE